MNCLAFGAGAFTTARRLTPREPSGNPKQVCSVLRGRHSGKDVLYVEIVFCRWSGALSVGCGHYVYGCVR